MSTNTAKGKTAPIEDDDTPAPTLRDVRHLAEILAPFLVSELASLLSARDNVAGADVSPRRGSKEDEKWRSEKGASASLDHIHTPENGGTHRGWPRRPKNLVASMRAKRKRNGSRSGVTQELQATEEPTIGDAKKEYAMYLRDDKNKPGSVEDTTYRLGMFFSEVDETGQVVRGLYEVALSSITSTKGEELYAGLRRRKTKTGKRPSSVDSHRNVLAEARSFLKWCMGKRWMARNPLDGAWREWEGGGTARRSSESTRRGGGRRRRSDSRIRGKEGRSPR